jgi:serine/threonine-protein kinase HipA
MSIEIHIDWDGKTHLVGHLHGSMRSAAVSFVYAPVWLNRADTFAIDPTSLPLGSGPLHSTALFGAIQDCGPDRWGRVLIERAVRKGVLDRKPYQEIDNLLALADSSRIGALRFRRGPEGPFLDANSTKVPPLVRLAALLRATDAIHGETETAADLKFLLGEGSPLGGARPKASVSLADGRLAIAKFPKSDDIRDIAAGEVLALTLAKEAGLTVADHRLVNVDRRSVSVITRFDRVEDRRIPFLSGASLTGYPPGSVGAYTT